MIDAIQHKAACVFTIFDDIAYTSQKFKFSYSGNNNTLEGDDTTAKNLIIKATTADVYPYVELLGNTDIHFHKTAGRAMLFYDAAVQAQKFTYAANVSTIEGGSAAGDDLTLKGNSNDTYPKILLEGDSNIKQYFKAGSAFYLYDSAVQAFKQSYAANVSTIEGGVTTGDDLVLKANSTDSYPYMIMNGLGPVRFYLTTNQYLLAYSDGVEFLNIRLTGTDCMIGSGSNNQNIYLMPHGTGVVKFGTYSAKGAEAFDGFITIKDAAGNARKIMTCA